MSIIISKKGDTAKKLDRSDFDKEDYLQDYIHKNPESIPVYEIEENKKLFVVKREFPTNAGPIDALAVDKDGDIYIVETKLFKNPDKRTVVAQALDYGAALWKHLNDFNEFVKSLDAETQKNFGLSFQQKIEEFFEMDNEQSGFALETMRKNLNEGNLKFVILMDAIDERLKDLIIYVNQNSQFDIYAVQLEYYKFNEYEIMIPKLFGVEVKKNIKSSNSQRKKWSREDFLNEVRSKNEPKTFRAIEELLNFSYQSANKITYGTGNEGIFSYKLDTLKGEITPFTVKSNGIMIFNLEWALEQGKVEEETMKRAVEDFSAIEGAEILDGTNMKKSKVSIQLSDVAKIEGELEKIKQKIENFKEVVRK